MSIYFNKKQLKEIYILSTERHNRIIKNSKNQDEDEYEDYMNYYSNDLNILESIINKTNKITSY
jgi:hypothetical protein